MIGRICHWKEMERWVPGAPAALDVAFPLVPVGELLRPRREAISAKEFSGCTPITIHFDGSIERRDRTAPFKGSMFAAYSGDVVFSKIDVRNGAITIVPLSFKKIVVTSEYPIHVPDTKLVDPRYLALLLRSPNFLHLLKNAASGTSGRKRVDIDKFSELEIPLPDPPEQTALLDAYEKARNEANALEAEAKRVERHGIQEFEAALGLAPPPDLSHRLLQIARYHDMNRWGHEALLQQALCERSIAHSQVRENESVSLGDFVEVTHGCSVGPSKKRTALEFLKISAVTRGHFRPSEKKFAPDRQELRKKFELRKGDVLICRVNGTLAYVGMSALVEENMPNLIFPDKIIRVRIKGDHLLPEFLWRLLQLPAMRTQIESVSRTAVGNHAIGSEDVNNLQIVLPPRETQKALIRSLQRARDKSLGLRVEAARLRGVARNNFLNAVFH